MFGPEGGLTNVERPRMQPFGLGKFALADQVFGEVEYDDGEAWVVFAIFRLRMLHSLAAQTHGLIDCPRSVLLLGLGVQLHSRFRGAGRCRDGEAKNPDREEQGGMGAETTDHSGVR